ncbi:MAG: DUF2029 domain-containing protein [Desulfobacterales bacterium]|nr:DUF2029 domain-containing protein [Desulfobacterales bacterium]
MKFNDNFLLKKYKHFIQSFCNLLNCLIKGPTAILSGIVILLFVFVYYISTWKTLNAFVLSVDHCDLLFCDFIKHYYPMGKNIFVSKIPAWGYFYSAFFAILLSPFGSIPLPVSVLCWGILQVSATALLCILPGYRFFKASHSRLPLLYVFIFATSFPLIHNMKWGQVSVFITLCIFCSLLAYQAGFGKSAVVVLAFATSIKYYPAFFLLYFLIRKEIRLSVLFIIATVFFLAIIPSFTLGLAETFHFHRIVNNAIQKSAWIMNDSNSQYFTHVVKRLSGLEAKHNMLYILKFLGYGIVLTNLWLTSFIQKTDIPHKPFISFSVLFLTIPFMIKTSWPHYFVFLPFCQIAFIRIVTLLYAEKWKLLLLYTLALLSMILSNTLFFNQFQHWSLYSYWGYLFFSNTLLLIAVYGYLAVFAKTDKMR